MQYLPIYFVPGLLVAFAFMLVKRNEPASIPVKIAAVILATVLWPAYAYWLIYGMFKKTPYCMFCGYVAEDQADIMEHIEHCPKHPAHQWAMDRDKYKAALDQIAKINVLLDEDDDLAMHFVAVDALK